MRTILNVLWFILGGGLVAALAWFLCGILMFVSIVGIPWGRAAFTLADLSAFPFGREAVRRDELTGREDIGTGGLGALGNVVWFILAGLWLAIGHVLLGVALCVTLIGIPFGIAHFKLAGLALAPIGKTVVPAEVAAAARMRNAEAVVEAARRQ